MSDDEIRRRLAESFCTDDRYEPTEQDYAEADKLLAARDQRHAHELAEKQRTEGRQYACIEDDLAMIELLTDLIDPEVAP